MCDAITALSVASVVAQTAGSYKAAKAQKETAKYNAAVARNNKIISDRQAVDARERGKTREFNFRRSLETLKGRQRSLFAGGGVVVDEDTPLDILGETAELGEIDALTIRHDAEREAYGFEVQGYNFLAQANLQDAAASNINPFFSAGSTLLTASTDAAFRLGFGRQVPGTPRFVNDPQPGRSFGG